MVKAIEIDFPFEEIDPVAELESWRKEINRPIYHIHKWWAKRLGSVFRAIAIGATSNNPEDIWNDFYVQHNFQNKVVLDPFMGSGTTLGECAKLGIKPIGCDINPISTFMVRQSLTRVDIDKLNDTFDEIKKDVYPAINQYYKTINPADGKICDALYFFWVKEVITPQGEAIPLFQNYVFSKNAYPKRKPNAQILCKNCGEINQGRYDCTELICKTCGYLFNPQIGPAKRQYVTDSHGNKYKIKDLVSSNDTPPNHRLYAIMALTKDNQKIYLKPRDFDFDLFLQASAQLSKQILPLPDMIVRNGYNTDQARGYNYCNWKQFFNDRQLLCLGILLKRILVIKDTAIKEHFLSLFSSTLEFNNMFCTFKGEGTGAVRHMFSNHILKPEKTPLENNVWGTHKSSGAFSTLFKSRLLRAKKYLDCPFEIQRTNNNGRNATTKIVCSKSINLKVTDDYEFFNQNRNTALILNGDSANLPIPDSSVNAVITDPPYFDFVHYSELSDFFFAWLAPVLKDNYEYFQNADSSHPGEVQNRNPEEFSRNLARVFSECNRVLEDEGLLIFSFHHSKPEGWFAIYQAITKSGFQITSAHPVKSEMSVGSPKSATRYPINIDAIMVCKKSESQTLITPSQVWEMAVKKSSYCYDRFDKVNRKLSIGDKRVIEASQILVYGSKSGLNDDEIIYLLGQVFDM